MSSSNQSSLAATILLNFENHRKFCPLVLRAGLVSRCMKRKTVESQKRSNLFSNSISPESIVDFCIKFESGNSVPRNQYAVLYLQGSANPSRLLPFPNTTGLGTSRIARRMRRAMPFGRCVVTRIPLPVTIPANVS